MQRRIGRQWISREIRVYLSRWYRVCTNGNIYIKRTQRVWRAQKCNLFRRVRKPYRPVRAYKLHSFVQRRIGPTMDFWGNSGVPIVMVPCLHQDNIYIKRKLRVWRAQKCDFVSRCKNRTDMYGTTNYTVSYSAV